MASCQLMDTGLFTILFRIQTMETNESVYNKILQPWPITWLLYTWSIYSASRSSIRKVRHEMKSHMANIKGLVAGEKYGEVERYIDKLDETVQELDYKFSTGNAVTDVIINDKYRRAAKSGTAFRVRFEYRETDTISAFDMGIILNNLLENAIEACEKLEQEKRRISLTLKRKNHFLLVEVENSFDGKLE